MRNYASPVFQHRHYAAIAKVMADHNVSEDFRNALSGLFRNDNPNFDAYRFDQAARGEPVNGKDKR